MFASCFFLYSIKAPNASLWLSLSVFITLLHSAFSFDDRVYYFIKMFFFFFKFCKCYYYVNTLIEHVFFPSNKTPYIENTLKLP